MASESETSSALSPGSVSSLAIALQQVRRADHWAQLARFAVVGASGYVVNLAIYWAALHAGLDFRAAATLAFAVALINNFAWNRLWTFRDSRGAIGGQAARFVTVSTAAFLVSLALLSALVRDLGAPKLLAQAVAIVAVMPVSFLANKLWSFGTSRA
jgi:putative flippase GtrA